MSTVQYPLSNRTLAGLDDHVTDIVSYEIGARVRNVRSGVEGIITDVQADGGCLMYGVDLNAWYPHDELMLLEHATNESLKLVFAMFKVLIEDNKEPVHLH